MSAAMGTSGSLVSSSLGLRASLVRALLPSTPPVRRALHAFHGKHRVTRPEAGADDALILEVRRLYEQAGLPPLKIHAWLTGLGLKKTIGWVRQTCQYHNRSHLVPVLGAAPYLESQS